MSSWYEADIGWPGGLQKIGVTVSGPVDCVSITGPPWKSSGGVPLAGSLAGIAAALGMGRVAAALTAAALTLAGIAAALLLGQLPIAGTTPPKPSARALAWICDPQALG